MNINEFSQEILDSLDTKPEPQNFDCKYTCNRCSEVNDVTPESIEGYVICEAHTKCSKCGFEDYWAYGNFESSGK